MSRIGKAPVNLPSGVTCDLSLGRRVVIAGPKGTLEWRLPLGIEALVDNGSIWLRRSGDGRAVRAQHGLSRALVANMVRGVSAGFVKDLEIQGVGFKASVKGDSLDLALGFSHPVVFRIPSGLKVSVSDNVKIRVEGIDRQLVGQAAADIRGYYPPEPYKGKGIRYAGEKVARKEGKTVQ